jgi:hypothetical protein
MSTVNTPAKRPRSFSTYSRRVIASALIKYANGGRLVAVGVVELANAILSLTKVLVWLPRILSRVILPHNEVFHERFGGHRRLQVVAMAL